MSSQAVLGARSATDRGLIRVYSAGAGLFLAWASYRKRVEGSALMKCGNT